MYRKTKRRITKRKIYKRGGRRGIYDYLFGPKYEAVPDSSTNKEPSFETSIPEPTDVKLLSEMSENDFKNIIRTRKLDLLIQKQGGMLHPTQLEFLKKMWCNNKFFEQNVWSNRLIIKNIILDGIRSLHKDYRTLYKHDIDFFENPKSEQVKQLCTPQIEEAVIQNEKSLLEAKRAYNARAKLSPEDALIQIKQRREITATNAADEYTSTWMDRNSLTDGQKIDFKNRKKLALKYPEPLAPHAHARGSEEEAAWAYEQQQRLDMMQKYLGNKQEYINNTEQFLSELLQEARKENPTLYPVNGGKRSTKTKKQRRTHRKRK